MKFERQILGKVTIAFLVSWAIFLAYLYFSLNDNLNSEYIKQNQLLDNQLTQLIKHQKATMLAASNNISSIVFDRKTSTEQRYYQKHIVEKLKTAWGIYQNYLPNLNINYYDKNKQLVKSWGPQLSWDATNNITIQTGDESGQGVSYFSCDDICYFNTSSSMSPYTFDFGILHLRIPVENIILAIKQYTQSHIILFQASSNSDSDDLAWDGRTYTFQTTTSLNHYAEIKPILARGGYGKQSLILSNEQSTYSMWVLDKYLKQNVLFLFSQNITDKAHQITHTFVQILIGSLCVLFLLVSILHYSLHQVIKRIQDLIHVFPIIGKGKFTEAISTLKSLSLSWHNKTNDEIDLLHKSTQKLTEKLHQLHNDADKRNQQLQILADYDNMTQVYNRRKFKETLHSHHRTQHPFALIIIDLDHFKLVNDTLGHAAGDQLLITIADILRSVVDDKGVVGRMGGDEFALLINRDSYETICQLMDEIISRISVILLNSDSIFIMKPSISTGIAIYPKDSDDLEELTTFADAAMYENKRLKMEPFNFYTGNEIILNLEKKTSYWASTIEHALVNQNIIPYFQPIIDAKSHQIIAFEALARLIDDNGDITSNSANEFIHYAEQSKAIIQIDRLMIDTILHKACRYSPQPTLMINLSNITLATQYISQYIQQKIKQYSYSPNKIVIEITESSEIKDYHHTSTLINDLHSIGIRFALDDFGTGYSSFNYISKMKFDFIKIDKTFLTGLLNNQCDSTNHFIIESIVNLAKKLNIQTVAEGVESKEYLDNIAQFDIDLLQGYLFAQPSADLINQPRNNNGGHLKII